MHSRSRHAARTILVVGLAACLGSPVAAAPLAVQRQEAWVQQTVDRASYTVSPAVGEPRSRFVATLANRGTSTIEVGNPWVIARRTPDGWRRLRHGRRCAWTMEARIIRPGGSWSQRVGLLGRRCSFRALEAGTYRVAKAVRFTDEMGAYREAVVRARFQVE